MVVRINISEREPGPIVIAHNKTVFRPYYSVAEPITPVSKYMLIAVDVPN
jgi:hypothetical protein